MAGRTRTTKKLAQRIDLNYFKRAYPIPRWRRILSVIAVGLCVTWLGWAGLTGKQSAFNAGPLAQGHTILTNNCSSCHVPAGRFGTKVTETACQARRTPRRFSSSGDQRSVLHPVPLQP